MKSLILIDIQNDFCPGGALAVPDGDAVVAVANRLTSKFDSVVASQDWHPANHKSFASQNEGISIGETFELNGLKQIAWPDHCVQGSYGAEFVAGLETNSIDEIFIKGTDPEIDSYSAFFDNGHHAATGLGDVLKAQNVTEVYAMGLATDYCVKFTVLDAIRLGFKTKLIIDGCRGVELNEGDIDKAVEEMRNAGAEIITAADV